MFTVAAQAITVGIYLFGLRPDPLVVARDALGTEARERPRLGFATLRVNRRARFAVGAVALSHATMVAVMSMTPVHLYGRGATLAIVGFTISLHIAGMFGLSPVFGWLADRIGRLPVLLGGQAILASALVVAWLGSESHTLAGVSLVLLGLGWSASTIAASTMLVDSVPLGDRPGVQGVSDLMMNLAGAAGGALAGPLLTAVSATPGLGLACMVLVAGVVLWALLRASAPVYVLIEG